MTGKEIRLMKVVELNRYVCVGLEITRKCNMNCAYCYVVPRPHPEPDLTFDDWHKIVSLLREEMKDRYLSFHLAGGEIFTKEGTAEFIMQLLQQGIEVSLVSNGLVVPELIFSEECFKEKGGLFNFQISIDGLKKEHETIRSHYDRVMGNLIRLLESGVLTTVRTTVHRGNIKGMKSFYTFLNRLGEKYQKVIEVYVQPVADFPRRPIKGLGKIRLGLEEYLEAGFEVDRYVETYLPYVYNSWRFVHDVGSTLDMDRTLSLNSVCFGCGGGYGFNINANGDVLNCEMDVPFLNLRDHIDRETIHRVVEILDEKNRPRKRCLHCPLNTYCGMCRLSPMIHGYTEGFGYTDCKPFMSRVVSLHREYRKKKGETGKLRKEGVSHVRKAC